MRKVEIKHLGSILNGHLSRWSVEVITEGMREGRIPHALMQNQEYLVDLDSDKILKNKFTGDTVNLIDKELKQMILAQPLQVWGEASPRGLFQ